MTRPVTRLRRAFITACGLVALLISTPSLALTDSERPTCSPELLRSLDMFNCIARQELPPIEFGPPDTFLDRRAREAFPQSWHQLGFDQRHNPVFAVPDTAPAFLRFGTFWSANITGLDFLRLGRALDTIGNPEAWGSKTAQYLGNTMGVSAAQGIVYVQLGRHEIWALDGASGRAIWQADVTTSAGMGETLVEEINGRLMVFVPVGDAAFTVQNAIDFSNGLPHDRGANFSGVYAFDGVTGEQRWRFATKGSSRPTPVYRNGKLYLATGGGEFFVLNAEDGKQLGSFTNPGEGFPGLASLNWFETADDRLFLIYGTIRPRRILAVDATDPSAPVLGWQYTPANATANARVIPRSPSTRNWAWCSPPCSAVSQGNLRPMCWRWMRPPARYAGVISPAASTARPAIRAACPWFTKAGCTSATPATAGIAPMTRLQAPCAGRPI